MNDPEIGRWSLPEGVEGGLHGTDAEHGIPLLLDLEVEAQGDELRPDAGRGVRSPENEPARGNTADQEDFMNHSGQTNLNYLFVVPKSNPRACHSRPMAVGRSNSLDSRNS